VLRRNVSALYVVLAALNLLAWVWALAAFDGRPALLGLALLAYGFGLRHAVDADHIAAIDNVTRKLMHEGRRPVAAGCFFALGHSSVVLVAATAIAASAAPLQDRYPGLVEAGGAIGATLSAAFLLVIAVVNAAVLVAVYRLFRRVRGGGAYRADELETFLAHRGLLGRLLRRLSGLVTRSWHMYPLGLLFGLGFDTASEIGLLGIAASEAAKGLPIWSILVFPALFTAGMALVDTTDGVLMLGAYGWALADPVRRLSYNLAITGLSVLVAALVGGVEGLGLMADKLGLAGGLWDAVNGVSDNLGILGYVILAVFVASWGISVLAHRLIGYDKIGSA
jgi:high-affinity nickel-transport protein